jgi:WhiB family redox-sensing transcriptional regulator
MTTKRDREAVATTDELPLSPEKIYTIVDAVASIGKLATLAVLDQTPNDFVGSIEICQRLEKAQGQYPGLRYTKESITVPYAYCSALFNQLGLVEIGEAEGKKGPVRGARITPQGSELWPAIAGAYLPWQDENPATPITDITGHSQEALRTGASNRIRILEYLLNHANGGVSIKDIRHALDISISRSSTITADMARVGLLSYKARIPSPLERTFIIHGPPDVSGPNINRMGNEMRAIILSLQAANYDAETTLDGLAIMEMAKEYMPDADVRIIWNRFRVWLNNTKYRDSGMFIEEIPTEVSKSNTSLVAVPEDRREMLETFLEKRNKLATDADFREETTEIGKLKLKNKEYVSKALRDAKRDNRLQPIEQAQWELTLLKHIPVDGIDIDTLYERIQTNAIKPINKKSFRKMLSKLDDLVDTSVGRDASGIHMTPYVRWKKNIFPANWQDFARCKQPNVDPDIFIPLDDEPKHIQRSKIAQAVFHCARCPVRPACLKDALENNERDGVWGGLSPKQLRSVKPSQKQKVLDVIRIGTYEADEV